MALTPEQRAELESYGPDLVRVKLLAGGPGGSAAIPGFKTGAPGALGGILIRSDVEGWLAEKHIEEAAMQRSTLTWAKIAGIAAIFGVIVGIASIAVSVWLAK
jgi:hypothetical protein